jgi:hypothetical protein
MNSAAQRQVLRKTIAHLLGLCGLVGGVGAAAVAPAVYWQPNRALELRLPPAAQSGFEGVACVDDAARLLVLLLAAGEDGWSCTSRRERERVIEGLTNFLLRMQTDDGRFCNFVLDWDGTPNDSGPTSFPGGLWWTARALRALAWASALRGSAAAAEGFRRGIAATSFTDAAGASVSGRWAEESMLVWAALDYETMHAAPSGLAIQSWAQGLLDRTEGAPVPDTVGDRGTPHLWGRSQELVLARVASRFHDDPALSLARQSAHEFLRPMAASGFRGRHTTTPYEVSSVWRNLRVVGGFAADAELAAAAAGAARWFWGDNAAGVPLIDAQTGRASDGLDGDRPSLNSGAEANIETLFVTRTYS